MTATAELAALEATYEAWINAGCPQSYSHNGRTVTRASAEWMSKRIDQLRQAAARESGTTGSCPVAKFRGQD